MFDSKYIGEQVEALLDKINGWVEVTESIVSGWGFTKNTGTYSKPSGGIPKSDLASGVIPTSLPANGGTSASCSGNAATATTLKTSRSLWGNSFNGSADISGDIVLGQYKSISIKGSDSVAREAMKISNTNALSVGKDANQLWLYAKTYISFAPAGTEAWEVTAGGNLIPVKNNALNIANSTFYVKEAFINKVTSSSDERLKDKICDNPLSVEQIADAPMIDFAWKSNGEKATGSIAQYWKPILPYLVSGGTTKEEPLSMDYAHMGLCSSIVNAREIVSLKKENTELKERLARLEELIRHSR